MTNKVYIIEVSYENEKEEARWGAS
jgi:hypothetical protein